MLFPRVVAVSESVAAASARNAKIALLADLFRALTPDEIEPVVAMLSGEPRQGRVGPGYDTTSAATAIPAADESSLTVGDVDRVIASLATVKGQGSAKMR